MLHEFFEINPCRPCWMDVYMGYVSNTSCRMIVFLHYHHTCICCRSALVWVKCQSVYHREKEEMLHKNRKLVEQKDQYALVLVIYILVYTYYEHDPKLRHVTYGSHALAHCSN